jgi:DNA-binding NarL/FixJ family response regulator
MVVRIAVTDPLPVFRRGVMAILREAGYEPEAPEDPLAWTDNRQTAALVVTLLSENDWELLAALHRSTADTVLVALLERVTVETSIRALRAGAACILPRDTSPSALSEAFSAAVNGHSLISLDVLRALTVAEPLAQAEDRPSAQERVWLRGLARGVTVSRLAADAGYSERMMFRLLRDLYTRMGAHGRTDALIKAQSEGWL